MKPIAVALTALAALAAGPGLCLAGPIYGWNWSNPGPGTFSNNGGRINWVESQFDTNNNRLRWTANFGQEASKLRTTGFTLALTAGPSPHPMAGEVALLYFDAEDAFASTGAPILTAYGFNGLTDDKSYMDGSPAAGVQTPDRILSSRNSAAVAWLYDISAVTEADGTRTMSFEIDVDPIGSFSPTQSSPVANGWHGIGYGPNIGVRMHTFSDLHTTYSGDYLTAWSWKSQGQLSGASFAATVTDPIAQPVPEPGSLALLGIGATFLGSRVRPRKNPV